MDDSSYMQIFSDTIEHEFQPEKTKDPIVLMKQKICKTNDLIKQYTDKIKDAERLKLDLEAIRKDNKHMAFNYKSVMDKTRELELNITDLKQENNHLESKIKEYEVFTAADKQHIQQLTCKIKEMEDEQSAKILELDLQKAFFEDEIKKLEHQLKISKKSQDKKKKSNIVITDNNITKPNMETKSSTDIGINVSLDDIKTSTDVSTNVLLGDIKSNIKPDVQDKNIMTEEFYHLKEDPYPLFCAKCTTHIYPPPIEKICQIMSACPDLIEPILSPIPTYSLSPLSFEKSNHSGKNIPDKEVEYTAKNIPDKQSQHSDKNTLDKEQEHSYLNVLDEKSDYSNRNVPDKEVKHLDKNKTASTSKVSSLPHLLIPMDCNSIDNTYNLQFESENSSATAQNLVNTEFKNEDHINYKLAARDLSSDPDLITKHSSSIRNIEKDIQLLKCKMKKQLKKMKKRINKKRSCHCTNCNSVAATSATTNVATSLNSDLLVNICKSMIKFNDNRRKVLYKKENHKNERNTKSKKYKCNTKKMKLKRLNNLKDEFSWKVENLHKTVSQDMVLINPKNTLPVIDQLLITETIIDQSDLSDKTSSPVHSTEVKSVAEVKPITEMESVAKVKPTTAMESVAKVKSVTEMESVATVKPIIEMESVIEARPVTEVECVAKMKSVTEMKSVAKVKPITEIESVAKMKPVTEMESVTKEKIHLPVVDSPVKDNIMTLYSSTDETYISNLLNIDNVKSIDSNYHTTTIMTLLSSSYSKSSINRFDDNIISTITAKSKSQNKGKLSNLLLKKIRNLKRKTCMNAGICSKQLKIESCCNDSEFYEPVKKRRIAHISKASVSQPDFERDSIDHTMESSVVESKIFANRLTNIQTLKNDTSEIKTDCTMSDKCDKNNHVKFTSIHKFNERSSIKDNLVFTKTKNSSLDNDNIASLINIRQPSLVTAAFVDPSNLVYSPVNNGTTLIDKTTIRTFNNCNKPVVSHNNILLNTISNEESNRYASSNVSCEDSENNELTEDIHANMVEATSNTSSHVALRHLVVPIKSINKNYNYTNDVAKDMQDEASDRQSTESQSSHIQIQGISTSNSLSVNSEETSKKCNKQSIVEYIGTQNIDRKFVKEDLHSPPLKKRIIIKNYVNNNGETRKSHDEVNIRTRKKEMHVNNDIKDNDIKSNDIEDNIKNNDIQDNMDNMDNNITNNDIEDNDIKDNIENNDMDNDITNNYIKDNNIENNDIKDNDIEDNDITNNDIKDDDITNNDIKHNDDMNNENEDIGKILTPKDQLCKYINNNLRRGVKKLPYKERQKAQKMIACADVFIKEQLTRLIKSNWDDCVHDDVIEKVASICGPRLIAKCIIEFLAQHSEDNITIDKSFTPPAPIMSKCEQKIIMMLIDLERLRPTVLAFVRTGIQYKLFKLNSKLKYTEADTYTRIYVVLARLQNDREAVRIICCDALYCLGYRAINVLHTVLTCWPEIFPKANTCQELLPKCIAFLSLQPSDITYKKLFSLKMLMTKYYQYPQEIKLEDIVDELMTALANKQQDGLNMAIILVAKKKGPMWAYENIIKTTLLPMIILRKYPCMYSGFCLLGKLMRSFPLKSSEASKEILQTVQNISKQLVDLLESNEFSDDEQEGIASALLYLSRQEFHKVTKAVIKWTPKIPLRPSTIAQIEAHIKSHVPLFWKAYVKKEKLFEIQSKT